MQPRMQRRLPVSSPRLRAFAGESWVHFLLEQLSPLGCTRECVVLPIRWQVFGDSASTRKTRLAERRRTMAAAYARYAAHCAPFLTAFGALEAFAVKPQSCLPTIGHRHHRDRVSAAALRAPARRRPPRMLCC